jgi:hypothetical protein
MADTDKDFLDEAQVKATHRDDLNARAREVGIQNPEQFGTKQEVADAINERLRATSGGEGDQNAREPSAPRSIADAQGQPPRGGAAAGDRDDSAASAASRLGDVRRGESDIPGNVSDEEERRRLERQDNAALAAGDQLDRGRPPSFAELQRAQQQAEKDPAKLAQEAADAALRQGTAGIGAEFQPPEGEKPAFVHRGRFVNPDGKKATRTNMQIRPRDDDEDDD